MDFREFFEMATGLDQGPYDYQCRLACGDRNPNEPEPNWLTHGTTCESRLINRQE
jgi:hypothetical protein